MAENSQKKNWRGSHHDYNIISIKKGENGKRSLAYDPQSQKERKRFQRKKNYCTFLVDIRYFLDFDF